MKINLHNIKELSKVSFIFSLFTVGAGVLLSRQSQAQAVWNIIDSLKPTPNAIIWNSVETDNQDSSQPKWEVLPENNERTQSSTTVIWELVDGEDQTVDNPPKTQASPKITPPTSLEEAELILNTIPLKPTDFKPLLNLSHAVPTASVIGHDEWCLIASTISLPPSAPGNQIMQFNQIMV